MGVEINGARFLIAARADGVRFDRMLTVGRQQLNIYPRKLRALLASANLPSGAFEHPDAECTFAEPFLNALGAKELMSLDASDYEGAGYVHDLNCPLPDDLRNRFDVVYDGGTLEHVFNFPIALKNCMEMLRLDGRLILHTPANNLCGHGFYQFSPELFFRAFTHENGFEVERCVVHVIGPYGRWYAVSDPDEIRERVELITSVPIHMLVQARRREIKPVFARWPQQSDYTTLWLETKASGKTRSAEPPVGAFKQWMRRKSPGVARLTHVMATGAHFLQRMSLRNRRFFEPIPKVGIPGR